MPSDFVIVRPVQDSIRGQLGAVVADDQSACRDRRATDRVEERLMVRRRGGRKRAAERPLVARFCC